jgi:hypothetical protein
VRERLRGHAIARRHVDVGGSTSGDVLAFQATGTIRGGHYATGNCVFGKLVNISGYDTGVTASYTVTGSIRVTARSDSASRIDATYDGLPANSRLSLRDPSGQAVNAADSAEPSMSGSGRIAFQIHGAGVYLLDLSLQGSQSINGAASSPITARGRVTAAVQ